VSDCATGSAEERRSGPTGAAAAAAAAAYTYGTLDGQLVSTKLQTDAGLGALNAHPVSINILPAFSFQRPGRCCHSARRGRAGMVCRRRRRSML